MTRYGDWDLPDRYWAEHHTDGRITLWLDETQVEEFCAGSAPAAIEAWAAAYAKGRSEGEASGRLAGRAQLAVEFRALLMA
jgi:hypothetical protein